MILWFWVTGEAAGVLIGKSNLWCVYTRETKVLKLKRKFYFTHIYIQIKFKYIGILYNIIHT